VIRSLYLSPDEGMRNSLGSDEIASLCGVGEGLPAGEAGVLWVDVTGDGNDERAMLHDVFGFHQLAIEDCYNGRTDTPKVDDYREYLFIAAQSVHYFSVGERLELAELDIFLGANYVVSVHTEEMPSIDELFQRAGESNHLMSRGADFLAHHLLDGLIDLLLPAVEEMDEALDDLEQRILAEPDKRHLPEVLLLKRNTLRLRRSILPQRDMVNRLSRGEFGDLIGREALMFYRDVYDHIVRVDEMLEGLRDLADSALNSYLSSLNNRMNEVMKTLSIVAVIFLPLTLIASIYGTNLDLSPGIEFRHGFVLMLGAMLLVSMVFAGYFKYRRWF